MIRLSLPLITHFISSFFSDSFVIFPSVLPSISRKCISRPLSLFLYSQLISSSFSSSIAISSFFYVTKNPPRSTSHSTIITCFTITITIPTITSHTCTEANRQSPRVFINLYRIPCLVLSCSSFYLIPSSSVLFPLLSCFLYSLSFTLFNNFSSLFYLTLSNLHLSSLLLYQ